MAVMLFHYPVSLSIKPRLAWKMASLLAIAKANPALDQRQRAGPIDQQQALGFVFIVAIKRFNHGARQLRHRIGHMFAPRCAIVFNIGLTICLCALFANRAL